MPEVLLETRGLGKRFGAVVAAEDVNVSVTAGEIVGVIGANGAGKTTFCNMVTGYLTPDLGQILFRGKDITGCTVGQATEAGIHRSFQIPQLFPGLTVYENLLLAVGVFGHRRPPWWQPLVRPEVENEATAIMERYRIAESATTRVDRLPQGVRKLLDIAMAMVGQPAMVLLDEPTSGISTKEKFDVMGNVIDALRKSAATVLFVEHDMEVVGRYADRVIAFREGSVLADGTPDVVLEDPAVIEHVVGRRPGHAPDA